MVKSLDEHHSDSSVIDHIGVDLWQAAMAWRDRLHRAMVARGHAWYGDARGAVAAHLDPGGLSQSALVVRMKLSKQAVQQLLDGLEADGIVLREPDPDDGRGKRVVYTAKGRLAIRDAQVIKRAIEEEYRAILGDRGFATLQTSLAKLIESNRADAS